MWPFKSKIVGAPVYINCGQQSAEFRKRRAQARVENLTAKLARLHSRTTSFPELSQEIANTKAAIRAWSNILELAELELDQQSRRVS